MRLGQMLNVCATNAIARVMIGRPVVGYGCDGGDVKAEEFKGMVVELMVLAGSTILFLVSLILFTLSIELSRHLSKKK